MKRVYLSTVQLIEVGPWSGDEIDAMIRRGIFRRGLHYFQRAPRARRVFSWPAIVAMIEGTEPHLAESARANRVDVNDAKAKLQGLLRAGVQETPTDQV